MNDKARIVDEMCSDVLTGRQRRVKWFSDHCANPAELYEKNTRTLGSTTTIIGRGVANQKREKNCGDNDNQSTSILLTVLPHKESKTNVNG